MDNKIIYKLIFCDLDHTLLVDHHIPNFNLEAINKAKEKGVKFVICTGRSFHLTSYLLNELNSANLEKEYTICNAGSTIYENKSQKLLYFKGIEFETIKLVFQKGQKFKDILIIFNTLDGAFVSNEEMVDKKKWKIFKYTVMKSIEDLKNYPIVKIIFFSKNNKNLLRIQNEIKNDKNLKEKISYYMSGTEFFEMNSFGVNKGMALKWLSNYLNIDIKETIAIGDDFNDISMIKEAGLGCCLKSANDDIKQISKYVCKKDFNEGSVKEVIDKFILN